MKRNKWTRPRFFAGFSSCNTACIFKSRFDPNVYVASFRARTGATWCYGPVTRQAAIDYAHLLHCQTSIIHKEILP